MRGYLRNRLFLNISIAFMRKKRLLLRFTIPLFLLLFCLTGFAQNRVILGRVTDSKDGTGLPGVTVLIKGTTIGVQTQSDGRFRIEVPPSATTLVISSIGYGIHEVPIVGGNFNVSLVQNTISTLNDVVVIGYGTQLKKDLTGSISSVNAKDFQQGAITSPDQLIAGKVAGVSVTSNGGEPGSSSTIRIRGLTSLGANNDPLIVLDGVELPSSSQNGTSTTAGIANPLDFINPDDIENVTILKDASAAAIYGSRASAGVILITTKKGKGGHPVYNFNTSLTVGTIAKYLPVLSSGQFRTYVTDQASLNPADSVFADKLGSSNTDWQKLIFQTAVSNNDNLSISGATNNMPYRISVGYHDEQGILKTDYLQRGTAGIHLSPHLLDDKLKIDLNLNGTITQSRFANTGAIGAADAFDPTQSPYQKGSQWGGFFEWANPTTGALNALAGRNPLALLEQYRNIGKAETSIGNIHIDYQLPGIEGLHAIADLGYDVTNGTGNVFIPGNAAQAASNSPGPGDSSKYKTTTSYVTATYELNYIKDIKSIKSNINLVALYSYTNTLTTLYNYPSFDAAGDTLSGSAPVYPTSPAEYTLISYVGRLIYTFNQKYILTASLRDDGSSRFSPSNRWGLFPAVAVAWRIKQEQFLKNVDWLTDLKVRGSYGVTGNQDGLLDYEYIPSYSLSQNSSLYPFGSTFYNTYAPGAFDASFKWEQTASANIGLDFGFFKNRITGSIDYYNKTITNLFDPVSVPAGTNFTNVLTVNVGSMTDHGVELNLSANAIKTKDFSWDLNFNFAYNKNTITKLTNNSKSANFYGDPIGNISGGTGNTIQINTVGYDPYSFFVLQQVYQKNGLPLEGVFVDRNRDGLITTPPSSPDAYHDHSPFAPVIMGFSTTLTYKKLSLTVVARANVGNYVYNNVAADLGVTEYMLNPLNYLSNASTDIFKSHFYAPQYYSDYYVENASFFRVDNIGLGYNVGKIGRFAYLRLSAYCQNVFVITKYSGQDPEVYGGIDNNLYPRPRNFTLGASLGF